MPKLNALDVVSGDLSESKMIQPVTATNDDEVPVMHHNGGRTNRRVTKVTYVPDAAITGDGTNNMKMAIVNKGLAGIGTVEVAGLTFAAGVDGVKGDGKDITLSTTLANLIVLPGEVLQLEKTENGTGLTMPQGLVEITYENVGDALV